MKNITTFLILANSLLKIVFSKQFCVPFYDFAKNVFPKLIEIRQINTFEVRGYWSDVGTISQYKQTIADVFNGECSIGKLDILSSLNGEYISSTNEIPSDCRLSGYNVIGANCKIGAGVEFESCVIFDNVEIPSEAKLSNCIVIPPYNVIDVPKPQSCVLSKG